MKNNAGPVVDLFGMIRDGVGRPHLCKVVAEVEIGGGIYTRERVRDFWGDLRDCVELFEDRGGMASDAVEPREMWEYTPEEIGTFYARVTKVTNTDTGHVYFADFEGYDYARYIYFAADFRTMYFYELTAYEAEYTRREEERKAREEAERAEDLAQKLGALAEEFHAYDPAKSFKYNLSQMLRDRFGCSFKISKKSHKWGGEWYTCTASAPVDRDEFAQFVRHIREDFRHYTGEECEHGGHMCAVFENVFFERFGGSSDIELR